MPNQSPIEPMIESEKEEVPFPIESLPDSLRLIVEDVCQGYDCGHGMFSLPVLVAMSAAIGNSHILALTPSWKVKPAIWAAIVACSGSGKSQPAGEAIRPLKTIDTRFDEINKDEWTKHDKARSSYEKQKATLAAKISSARYGTAKVEPDEKKAAEYEEKLNKLKSPEPAIIRQVCIGDTTQEALVDILASNPRGCVVAVDEIASFLGGIGKYNGAERAEKGFYNALYEGDTIVVNRKGRLPLRVDNPSCALFGTIQPALVDAILNQEDKNSGFAGRLMLCRVPKVWRSFNSGGVPAEVSQRYESLIDEIWRICPTGRANDYSQPIVCQVSHEAAEAYEKIHNETETLRMSSSGFAESLWAKCRTYTGKLSLIFHVAENRSNAGSVAVTAETLVNAYKLARYFVNQALDIDVAQRIGVDESQTMELIEAINEAGGTLSIRDVMRSFQSEYPRKLDLEPMIEYLVERELAYVKKVTPDSGGRPSSVVALTEHGTALIESGSVGGVTKRQNPSEGGFSSKKPR